MTSSSKDDDKVRDCYNWQKALFIPFYLIPIFILLSGYRDSAFYTDAFKSYDDLGRLFGCIAFSCAGFALLAGSRVKTHKGDLDFPWSYLFTYPFVCTLNGLAVFVVWQMNKELRGYLFSLSAYPVAFLVGFFADLTLPILYQKLLGLRLRQGDEK